MKVKIKLLDKGCFPIMHDNGDLFDVYAAETVKMKAPQSGVLYQKNGEKVRDVNFENQLIPLGFCMEIPKGFKANLYPRSSTYKKWGIIFANHVGQIDSSYCSDKDEWKVSALALQHTVINKYDKIAQFEIVPSSKATFWQKLKWLFSSKVTLKVVDHLDNPVRGGFGSTGFHKSIH